ncbi:unnamed protein product [Arctia plantaginis]|uniref:Uncharacterized protein n=1 Tax=Arctia plantaginis TaxID=874455 RepID=A0A8S0Z9R8_ARCPL|nr:unnamed protein product [Arctia plantaginis]
MDKTMFIILAAVTLAQAAKLDRVYLPPNAQAASGSDNFLRTPYQSNNGIQEENSNDFANAPVSNENAYSQNAFSDFEARPERAQAAFERNAAILRQDNSNDGETYSYTYETENGIFAEENGVATNGVQAQGGYTYTGDDGNVYTVRYTADENGFVPQGDHLPTPPPIPEEILKALEQNARDEAAGIYDDGSYSEAKYGAADSNSQQYYNNNAQPIDYNEDSLNINSAGLRNDGDLKNTIEKTYLPPFAQQNNNRRNYNSRDGSSKDVPTYNNQQQYYNTNTQLINYKKDSIVMISSNSPLRKLTTTLGSEESEPKK